MPELVAEENWFFRLSRYAGQLRALIDGGAIRIEPAGRRNETLALIDGGLHDFSVSRSRGRARGWGIPVPGDPGQVIYVWWDALGNYLTALDYAKDGENLGRWWAGASRRIHLLGKGVLRFHAVYWPAILLSAGKALPTDIAVHGYLTENGRKISKSGGTAADPYDLAARYGTDAVRWWLLREVPPGADADYTARRLVSRANEELAEGVGNLVNRVVSLVHRYLGGHVPTAAAGAPGAAALEEAVASAPARIAVALEDFDFRRATEAVWQVAREANRYAPHARPWELAKAGGPTELAAVLSALLRAVRPPARCWPRSSRTPRPASPASAPRRRPGCSPNRPRSCPGSPCQPPHTCPHRTGRRDGNAGRKNRQVPPFSSCRFSARMAQREHGQLGFVLVLMPWQVGCCLRRAAFPGSGTRPAAVPPGCR